MQNVHLSFLVFSKVEQGVPTSRFSVAGMVVKILSTETVDRILPAVPEMGT